MKTRRLKPVQKKRLKLQQLTLLAGACLLSVGASQAVLADEATGSTASVVTETPIVETGASESLTPASVGLRAVPEDEGSTDESAQAETEQPGLTSTRSAVADTPVEIANPALKAAVLTEVLTQAGANHSEIAKYTEKFIHKVDADGEPIVDADGEPIEEANPNYLNRDITEAELQGVESLFIKLDSTDDLAGIERVSNLQKLSFYPRGESGPTSLNLALLANLPIKELKAYNNTVPDEQISYLPHLESFDGGITSLNKLASLPNLKSLKLSLTEAESATDLSLISRMTNLEKLSLYAPKGTLATLPNLSSLTKLRSFSLTEGSWHNASSSENSETFDVNLIKNNKNLVELKLSSALNGGLQLEHVDGLSNLSYLRKVDFSNVANLQDSLAHVAQHPLKQLYLYEGELTDLSPLSQMTSLKVVSVHRTNLTRLPDLSGLTKLEILDLQSNQLVDVSSLQGMGNIKKLNLKYNRLTRATPLLGLTTTDIDLSVNPLQNPNEIIGYDNIYYRVHLPHKAVGFDPVTNRVYKEVDAEIEAELAERQRQNRHVLTDSLGSSLTVDFAQSEGANRVEVVAHLEPNQVTPNPVARLAGKDFDLYDIKVKDANGNFITNLTHTALVKLPVDNGKIVEKVIYLPEVGDIEDLPIVKQEAGFVFFEAKHFSHYGIVYRNKENEESQPLSTLPDKKIRVINDYAGRGGGGFITIKPGETKVLYDDKTASGYWEYVSGPKTISYDEAVDGQDYYIYHREKLKVEIPDKNTSNPNTNQPGDNTPETNKPTTGTPVGYLPGKDKDTFIQPVTKTPASTTPQAGETGTVGSQKPATGTVDKGGQSSSAEASLTPARSGSASAASNQSVASTTSGTQTLPKTGNRESLLATAGLGLLLASFGLVKRRQKD